MAYTRGSASSLWSSFPIQLQTLRAFPTFLRTSVHSSSDQSKILPRYLKVSTPSMHSESSSPVKMNVAPLHQITIVTSFLRHHICMFQSHRFVCWCFSSLPAGMYILHKSQWGSGSLPSCTTAIRENKFLYMKCSLIQPTICATARHPGTGHLTVFGTFGKETT